MAHSKSKISGASRNFTKIVNDNAFKILMYPCKVYIQYDDKDDYS